MFEFYSTFHNKNNKCLFVEKKTDKVSYDSNVDYYLIDEFLYLKR